MTDHVKLRRMSCEAVLRRLDEYLDRELDSRATADVEAHLHECEACAREFGFERTLLDRVRAKLRSPGMPSSLRDRVSQVLADARRNDTG